MEINITTNKSITPESRAKVLSRHALSGSARLAVGTEAEVYQLPGDKVLKIYGPGVAIAKLQTLQRFYYSIDRSAVKFQLPLIEAIEKEDGAVATIETQLKGVTLESILASLSTEQRNKAERLYFAAAKDISLLKLKNPPDHRLLLDDKGKGNSSKTTWQTFYATLLEEKLSKCGETLGASVSDLKQRSQSLLKRVQSLSNSVDSIVHGDFYPGNLLVAPDLSAVTGVIDFGSFTIFGDKVVDLATSFAFYRMYDPNRVQIRKELLPLALSFVDKADHPRFFVYLIGQAIITCDIYVTETDPMQNGHFKWAVEILNDEKFWARALS